MRQQFTGRAESLRGIRGTLAAGAVLVMVVTVLAPAQAYPRPGTLERVSVGANGVQSARGALDIGSCQVNFGRSIAPCSASISANGRFVVFSTLASNLVENDGNHVPDVFLRDRQTGRTELVSVSIHGGSATVVPLPNGNGLSGGSFTPDVSADGRFVVFASNAVDLVLGTKNPSTYDVFIRDRKTGTTERVSVGANGLEAAGNSNNPVISADGRYVAFDSDAPNLVAGKTPTDLLNTTVDVFRWDRLAKKIVQVSVSSQGTPGDAHSRIPSINADGRYVLFRSDSTNLDGTNRRVFIRDLRTAKTQGWTTRDVLPGSHAISADGRYVVFYSSDTTWVPHDSGALGGSNIDSFVYDRKTGLTERVSVTSSGAELNEGGVPGTYSEATYPTISADGRFVAFLYSTDLFPIANPNAYVMVHDRLSGSTEEVSLIHTTVVPLDPCEGQDGHQPSNATPPGMAMSSDARYVSFISCLGLVKGDTNKAWDVFVRDRGVVQGVNSLRNIALAVNANSQPSAAKVVYRPASNDLLARIDVASMPSFALASPATVYGLDLSVHGVRYQVRAAKVGADAVFGVFRLDPVLGWLQVSSLHGGYGTVAPGVTVAVPLEAIGATGLSDLQGVTAFAGPGSFATGPLDLTNGPT